MTTAINLNALLKQTIVLTRENEEWSTEQIIAELMSNHVEIQSLAPISVAAPEKPLKASKAETEKKSRTRSAPAKPRAIPEDETRCGARSFYEKEHLEGNVLKVMRDDTENLYGDRCKFKTYVEKTENPEAVVAPAPKKAAKPTLIDDDNEESEAEAEAEEEVKIAVKKPVAVAAAPKKAVAPKIEEPVEEATEEVEECTIDGTSYLKDAEGTIYDPDTEDVVGKYNFSAKKWSSKTKK